jgi:hypothetical protein
MLRLNAVVSNLSGNCGIISVTSHGISNNNNWKLEPAPNYNLNFSRCYQHPHAGWCLVSFIDVERCQKMYKKLTSEYKLVFQSEVRKNTNTGNQFFFIILDTTKKVKK